MDYFAWGQGPQDNAKAATTHAVNKLSNGAALTVAELSKEPQRGLVHVADHIQKSVPGLIQSKKELQRTHAQLKAALEDLTDANQALGAIVHPDSHTTLLSLATSIQRLQPAKGRVRAGAASPVPAPPKQLQSTYSDSLSAAAAAMTSSLNIARLW